MLGEPTRRPRREARRAQAAQLTAMQLFRSPARPPAQHAARTRCRAAQARTVDARARAASARYFMLEGRGWRDGRPHPPAARGGRPRPRTGPDSRPAAQPCSALSAARPCWRKGHNIVRRYDTSRESSTRRAGARPECGAALGVAASSSHQARISFVSPLRPTALARRPQHGVTPTPPSPSSQPPRNGSGPRKAAAARAGAASAAGAAAGARVRRADAALQLFTSPRPAAAPR